MLEKRQHGVGIFYVGDVILKREIVNGDRVTLKAGDESVLVKDTHVLETSSFSGEIYGFEPSCKSSFAGLRVGEKIDFDEANIISCSS